ncbi:MAG TPA: hypothetical protein PLZ53_02835 [Candidatus Hydrogenedentes bacterium]|nr:hypothetical protein [Candidatus Hydrogenedentota bacterium]
MKTHKQPFILFLAIALTLGASFALAQNPPASDALPGQAPPELMDSPKAPLPPARGFDQLDVNKDGAVSREEFSSNWLPCSPNRFARLDVNNDGVLSKDELANCPVCGGIPQGGRGLRAGQGPMGPGGGYCMAPGQGRAAGRGAYGMGPRQGRAAGRGAYGMGPRQGRAAGRGAYGMGPRQGRAAGRGAYGMGPGQGRAAGRGAYGMEPGQGGATGMGRSGMNRPALRPLLQNVDTNQDQKITQEEYEKAWQDFHKEQFDLLDTNKDGSLTADELPPRFAPRTR